MLLSDDSRDEILRPDLRNMRNISLNGISADPYNRTLEFIARRDRACEAKFELRLRKRRIALLFCEISDSVELFAEFPLPLAEMTDRIEIRQESLDPA